MSLKSSALILRKKVSFAFCASLLFDGSLIDVIPAQGKRQKHMIWYFFFYGK